MAAMTGPFGRAAEWYMNAGWFPIPVPYGEKNPPVGNYTGWDGDEVTPDVVAGWITNGQAVSNCALRLNPDLIGLDVDQYDGKSGWETWQEIAAVHGEPPPTWRSTARGVENRSGIRLYRLPFPAEKGWGMKSSIGGIDTIHFGHRFMVVAPSYRNDIGREYEWITPDGKASKTPPTPGDLPTLPPGWFQHFTAVCVCEGPARGASGGLIIRREGKTPEEWHRAALDAIEDGQGRHDTVRDALMGLIGEGTGESMRLAHELRAPFIEAVTTSGGRTRPEAHDEWERLYFGAFDKRDDTRSDRLVIHAPKIAAIDTIDPAYKSDDLKAYGIGSLLEWGNTPPKYVIPGWMVEQTKGVIGGPMKSLKSTIGAEIVVALTQGVPLFGDPALEPTRTVPVLVVVNEGAKSYVASVGRVLKRFGIDQPHGRFSVMPAVGIKAAEERTRGIIEQFTEDHGPGIILFDALYGIVGGDAEASNLFAMREVFDEVDAVATEFGHDPWLIHHMTKHFRGEPHLHNLAWGGIAEWADSWVLLTHATAAKPDEGKFHLGVKNGSRQWGESLWEVHAELGVFNGETYSQFPQMTAQRVGHDAASGWGGGGNHGITEKTRGDLNAAIIQAVVTEPFVHTKTSLAKMIAADDSLPSYGTAQGAIDDYLKNGTLCTKSKPGNEGKHRDRLGFTQKAVEGQQAIAGVPIPVAEPWRLWT